MGQLFVTAFGPFDGFEENPSEVIAASLRGICTQTLPVSFRAVDAFIEKGLPPKHDRLLMLGVCAHASKARLESAARNRVSSKPDIDGCIKEGTVCDGPEELYGTLFVNLAENEWREVSSDAGTYLCNYIYYLALFRMPDVKSGFLHVPPTKAMRIEDQIANVSSLIRELEEFA